MSFFVARMPANGPESMLSCLASLLTESVKAWIKDNVNLLLGLLPGLARFSAPFCKTGAQRRTRDGFVGHFGCPAYRSDLPSAIGAWQSSNDENLNVKVNLNDSTIT